MALIFVTLAMGDKGQNGSSISSRKSRLICLEIQILTDMKGSVLASKHYPRTRHVDSRAGAPLGQLWKDQSLNRRVLLVSQLVDVYGLSMCDSHQ